MVDLYGFHVGKYTIHGSYGEQICYRTVLFVACDIGGGKDLRFSCIAVMPFRRCGVDPLAGE